MTIPHIIYSFHPNFFGSKNNSSRKLFMHNQTAIVAVGSFGINLLISKDSNNNPTERH